MRLHAGGEIYKYVSNVHTSGEMLGTYELCGERNSYHVTASELGCKVEVRTTGLNTVLWRPDCLVSVNVTRLTKLLFYAARGSSMNSRTETAFGGMKLSSEQQWLEGTTSRPRCNGYG